MSARFYVFARHIDNVRYVAVDDQSQFRTKEHAKSSLEVFHLVADKYFSVSVCVCVCVCAPECARAHHC